MIFRDFVIQNFPFLENDFDALTDYELFCKMVGYMKKSLEKIDKMQDELNEFEKELEDLDNYIHNLDLQDEVDNKLDEMAESGQLSDIIAQYLELAGVLAFNDLDDLKNADNLVNGSFCKTFGLESYNDGYGAYYKIRTLTSADIVDNINIVPVNFSETLIAEKVKDHYLDELKALIDNSKPIMHFIDLGENNGESTAIEIEDNNILIDIGGENSFNTLKTYLLLHNITKFKYFIVSHWDIDHSNTAPNFISLIENSDFDFSDCIFIFPHHNIDWTRTIGIEGQKTRYETVRDYLIAHNYTIIYPEEEQIINIDSNNYLKFYNLKSEFFDDYYVLTDDAGNSQDYTNYNNFSMVAELNSNKKAILFTGDINYLAEDNIYDEIEKIDFIKIPHHGINRYANQMFLNKCAGKIGVYTSTLGVPVLRPYYQMIGKDGTVLSTLINGDIVVSLFQNEFTLDYQDNLIKPNVYTIQETTDLNNLLKEGTYLYNNTSLAIANMPTGYNNQFIMKVLQLTSTITYQFMYTFNVNPIIWVRKYAISSWTDWTQISTSIFSYIYAYNSSAYTITSTAFEKIPMDSIYSQYQGGSLTLTENGTIKIGKGVSAVRVKGSVIISSVNANDRICLSLNKGNTVIDRIDTYAPQASNNTFEISTLMSVTENDEISLNVRNVTGARGSVQNLYYNSNLQVEVLK